MRTRPPALVDTIRVSGDVDPRSLPSLVDSTVRRKLDPATGELVESSTRGYLRLGCGAMVRLVASGPATFATVEFSVPTLLWGHNLHGAQLHELNTALTTVYDQVAEELAWEHDLDDLYLLRVDLVRDFTGVRGAPQLLERLAHVTRQPPAALYQGRDGGIQTLCRGPRSKRWLARAYDKHEQLRDLAAQSRDPERHDLLVLADRAREILRVEIQLRGEVLAEQSVHRVGDLTEQRADELRERYFRRAGFDKTVGGRTSLAVAAQQLREAGRSSEFGTVVEWLSCEAFAIDYPRSHNTRTKAKRIAKAMGLTPADILHPDIEPVRLDYDRGVALRGWSAEPVSCPQRS